MTHRDGHIRVLPLHVANKIAAGEVVERPASVVKELVENAIDAGSTMIRITITQGGRKLVAVQDDGCGMSRDDAILSLERQATSKILDVNDIEEIDTLGFRGEAIPSIASVSRFTITTRRHDSDEGTLVQVNAGQLADVRTAGCPPGTLIEVRDLFCNVPARRKFLRAYATEESHIRHVFTVHALAHPTIGFSLTIDGREVYRLSRAGALSDRILDLFGPNFVADLLAIPERKNDTKNPIRVSGYIEKPNLNQPTRRDQFVFINGRPATAPSITYALREAYPRRQGDVRPATILFIDLPPSQVDVNVHPTKREVRFRDNASVRDTIISSLAIAMNDVATNQSIATVATRDEIPAVVATRDETPAIVATRDEIPAVVATRDEIPAVLATRDEIKPLQIDIPRPAPVQVEFAIDPDSTSSKPWQWFRFLAQTATGFLLIETDSGIVTIYPKAARERIVYEALANAKEVVSQTLLIPSIIKFSPSDAARLRLAMNAISSMGFAIEEFGSDTFKIDAVPQIIGALSPDAILATIARDFADSPSRGATTRWREELIAKSVARAFAGATDALTQQGATKLVEELCACKMPYVCPRGKPIMIFTSTRELNRKFAKD